MERDTGPWHAYWMVQAGNQTKVVSRLALLLVLLSKATMEESPRLLVQETFLATLDSKADARTLSVDETASHVIWITRDAAGRHAVYDGKPGPPFEEIEGTVLSSDGTRYAYTGRRNKQWFIVIDGREHGPYHGPGQITFSPDSRRVAFAIDNGGAKFRLVVDNVEYGPFRGIPRYQGANWFVFSGDSRHFAFRAVVKTGHLVRIVVDGVDGPAVQMAGHPRFSPDGSQVAYWAKFRGEHDLRLLVDGETVGRSVEGSEDWLGTLDRLLEDYKLPFVEVGGLAFVTATKDGQMQWVVNGTGEASFHRVSAVAFSADGEHRAYVGKRVKRGSSLAVAGQMAAALLTGGVTAGMMPGPIYGRRLVFDGVERADYAKPSDTYTDEYTNGPPVAFMADGRVVYGTDRGVAIDGVEGKGFDAVVTSSISVSPDGKRLVYVARQRGKWVTVVDSEVGPENTGRPFFTADSRHVVYFIRQGDAEGVAVLGCGESPLYTSVPLGVASTNLPLHFVGMRGNSVYRVTLDTSQCW